MLPSILLILWDITESLGTVASDAPIVWALDSSPFCKKGTTHRISILQEKQKGGSVFIYDKCFEG